jgi:hypothetical protein
LILHFGAAIRLTVLPLSGYRDVFIDIEKKGLCQSAAPLVKERRVLERLERDEEWLLTQCYAKTVKKKLPDTWRVPRWFTWHHKPIMLKDADPLPDIFWGSLYKSEVLLNYFDLETSSRQASHYRHPPGSEYFLGADDRIEGQRHLDEEEKHRAHAIRMVSMAKENLGKRGLIRIEKAEPNASKILLTEKGERVAEESYSSGPRGLNAIPGAAEDNQPAIP